MNLKVIALGVLPIGGLVLGFGYFAGFFTPNALSPKTLINQMEFNNGSPPPGFRRAHAKGICVKGYFESNGAGEQYSSVVSFKPGRTPVLGRLSIGTGTPHAPDAKARTRSMGVRFLQPDGQEWRMAMNNPPFLGVSDAAMFYANADANKPDPATGKPNPDVVAAFDKAHPTVQRFKEWGKNAPHTSSFVNESYNSINAFLFKNNQGVVTPVRWSMKPIAAMEELSPEIRENLPPNYLQEEFKQRLTTGPQAWNMVVTIAEPGDPVDDPSQKWPDERKQVIVGKVVFESAQEEATGECLNVNFDPLILPSGVMPSNDSILHARSAAYSESFNRRLKEEAKLSSEKAL